MTRKETLRTVKGMRDILPPESALWNRIERASREVFAAYNYQEIRTPLVEVTDLFARGVGTDTDIVTKEMYTWVDHESRWLPGLAQIIQRTNDPTRLVNAAVLLSEDIEEALHESTLPKTRQNEQLLADLKRKIELLKTTLDNLENPSMAPAAEAGLDFVMEEVKGQVGLFQFGPSVSLRPEATASVVRSYIEHSMWQQPGLKKFYYIGPMFRRERPQKGRYRQFYQIGAEAIGSESAAVDAELLEMLIELLGRLGLTGYTLFLNSVGCSNCRPKYLDALRSELSKVREQLCADCQRRSETNPLRVLDCNVPEDQPIIEQLPTILDLLCAECREHFERLQGYLRERQIPFTVRPRLVRGLDYYTRTTFEIVHGALGAQDSLLGGGRYDGLSEMLGGPAAPGIGFSIGEDRFALALSQLAESESSTADSPLFLIWLGEKAYRYAAELARELRAKNVAVELLADAMKLKKALELASRLGVRHALLIGDQELAEGKYPLRDMSQGTQKSVAKEELFEQFAGKGVSTR